QLAAIHQGRFAVAPFRLHELASQVALEVDVPAFLAVGEGKADEFALATEGVESVPIDGGSAAWSVAVVQPREAADLARPDLLAAVGVQGEHDLVIVLGAHRVEAVANDSGARVAVAGVRVGPQQFRAVRGPVLEQSFFPGDFGTFGTAPLRPV